MKIIRLVNELFYPEVVIVLLPQVFLGYLASQSTNLLSFFCASLIIILVDFAGNVLNNYADWKIDEKNKKRMYLHQKLDRKSLLLIFIVLSCLLFLTVSLNFNLLLLIFVVLGYLTAVFYSIIFRLKF